MFLRTRGITTDVNLGFYTDSLFTTVGERALCMDFRVGSKKTVKVDIHLVSFAFEHLRSACWYQGAPLLASSLVRSRIGIVDAAHNATIMSRKTTRVSIKHGL